jgi:hypothetical protein
MVLAMWGCSRPYTNIRRGFARGHRRERCDMLMVPIFQEIRLRRGSWLRLYSFKEPVYRSPRLDAAP